MHLKSLTYTSLGRLDLSSDDLIDIHRAARHRNALNGITGLLIFNGTHFLQVVEGVEEAMWAAYRALEESANMARRLGDQSRQQGLLQAATRYDAAQEASLGRARLVRRALDTVAAKSDIDPEGAPERKRSRRRTSDE